ncbi:hypothetical protein ACFYWN_20385 [Streptomyces sp. NPDC002917]|uniref:hypothetical protein n=1 Tax=Streptomyces sp. NPDC002917 TaxID=3364671 RepID=UPI0036AC20EE
MAHDDWSTSASVQFILIGAALVVGGVALRRRYRRAPSQSMPKRGDKHGREAVQWITGEAAPYFLLFCGSAFLLGGVSTLIAYLTGYMG